MSRKNMQMTFRHVTPTVELTSLIEREFDKLQHLCGSAVSCSVVVEQQHRRHRRSSPYQARVELTLPGRHLVAKSEGAGHGEDARLALYQAFEQMQRLATDYLALKHRHRRQRMLFMPVADAA